MMSPYQAYKVVISERDRITRSEFNFFTLYSMSFNLLLSILLIGYLILTQPDAFASKFSLISWPVIIILGFLFLLSSILQIISQIKRGHDLGLSGLIVLPLLFIFSIFALLALMLLPGSKKPNSYGPSLREAIHDETFS